MMLYLRSALFLVWFIAVSAIMNVGALPVLLLPSRVTLKAAHFWARLVLFGLKGIAGIGVEVRGRLEDPRVLIAAKHFSMWETIALLALLPRPAIVLKHSLLRVPFYGWYCRKMRMIAIDRTQGAKAIRLMHGQARRALEEGRPIVIFPEGTRRKLGAPPDYKPGVAGLYAQLHVPCVPVAHNSGLFWAGGFLKARYDHLGIPSSHSARPAPSRLHGLAGITHRGGQQPSPCRGQARKRVRERA